MEKDFHRRLINVLLILFVSIFLVSATLPKEAYQAIKDVIHLKARHWMFACLILVLLKSWQVYRSEGPSKRFLEVAPLLVLFLVSANQFSAFPEYHWGVDDACYYSYAASVVMDGDLDLSNQYRLSGLDQYLGQGVYERKTARGYVENIFPVGLSLFSIPFFLVGHLIALMANSAGFAIPLNGYSRPYVHAVMTGNIFYVCAGLYLCYRFASMFFSKFISFVSVSAILLTTPLLLFFKVFALYSEPLSMTLIALTLLLVQKFEGRFRPGILLLIGLLIGAMTTVRYHNALFLFAPIAFLWMDRRQQSMRQSLPNFVALGFGVLVGFLPQLIVWKILYGTWFQNIPGQFLPWWKKPFILETLFSSRKGLFPFSPILVFCFGGLLLFLRRNKRWAAVMAVLLFLNIYLNASQLDWWGSAAFGARRFTICCAIFVVGFASFWSWLKNRWKLAGSALAIGLVLFFGEMNRFLVNELLVGKLEGDHADRFGDVFTNGFYRIYKYVVYPLEFPVQFYYQIRYDIPMYGPLNEFFIGDDILYLQQKSRNLASSPENPFFGEGWVKNGAIRSTRAPDCFFRIPMFFKGEPNIMMEMQVKPADQKKDTWIDFYLNGIFLRTRAVPAEGGSVALRITRKNYSGGVNVLKMHIYRKKTEKRIPVLILEDIRFSEIVREGT